MSLIIVESPAKCCTIEQHLRSYSVIPYTCIACWGHFMELDGLGAIHPRTYQPTFTPMAKRKAVIKQLLAAAANADDIILATDDDREGEAIAWHLCHLLKLPVATTKRMRFHDLSASSLHHALANCDTINMNVVLAQQARQVIDMLVGYKVSPILSQHLKKHHLSAGRCQTPALRLVYDNHMQVMKAEPRVQYEVTGYFTSLNLPFRLHLADQEQAQEFLQASKSHAHIFLPLDFMEVYNPAPLPFNTSTLLQTAKTKPSETMELCQSLYDKGYITYMRTDSQSFSLEFQASLNTFLLKEYNCKEVFRNPSSTNAHEAIRPTLLHISDIPGTKKEQDMYHFIRNRTLQSGMPQAVLTSVCASITAPLDHMYHYNCTTIVSPGWLQIKSQDKDDKDEENTKHYMFLQNLKTDSVLPYKKITAKAELIGLVPHISETHLISLLEKHKIGRPSTYASLVSKIQERQYVKVQNTEGTSVSVSEYALEKENLQEKIVERTLGAEKNKLVMTDLGLQAIAYLLQQYEPLFAYAYTKEMEEQLDLVVLAKMDFQRVCMICDETLSAVLSLQSSVDIKEQIYIDETHTYITGQYGPVVKVRNTTTGNPSFLALSGTIDLEKLREGNIPLEEVVLPKGQKETAYLGEDPVNGDVWLKAGKFGRYLEVGPEKRRLALKGHPSNRTSLYKVTLADVHDRLIQTDTTYIRVITPDASLRSGPHGDYIYYKSKKMKKPKFLPLAGVDGQSQACPEHPRDCDLKLLQEWFHERYKV